MRLWIALTAWTALWALLHVPRSAVSWHFFDAGARLLFSDGLQGGGLSLYAVHPDLQIGPLSFVFAAALRVAAGSQAKLVAIVLMAALGPMLLALAAGLRVHGAHVRRGTLAIAGLAFLPVWTEVAVHYAHLDDVLALTFALLAMHAVQQQRPVLAGLLLACAADSKPWAAAFMPLLFALIPGSRVRGLAAWVAGITAAWLPFLIATPATLRAGAFKIPNAATSALRALGITSPDTPAWDRPVQFLLGLLVATLCVRAGRWPAVPFAVIAVRLLLDPGAYAYYTSGLVLAAVLVDLLIVQARIPLLSLTAVVAVYLLRATPLDLAALGQVRATFCFLACAMLFLPRLANGGYLRVLESSRAQQHHAPIEELSRRRSA